MRVLAATIMLVLFASFPANAANELQGLPLAKIEEMAKAHGVTIEKLNPADTAAMDDAAPGRPTPSTIYLLTLNSSVIIALVHEGMVIFSADPQPLQEVKKALKRIDA